MFHEGRSIETTHRVMQSTAVSSVVVALGVIFASCATTKTARVVEEPDLVIDVASNNVRVGNQMFPTADDTALRAAISGACSDGCGTVEVRPTPGAPFVALYAIQVALASTEVKNAQIRFASDDVVPLGRDPQTTEAESCPAQIVGLPDRMYVYVAGKVLPPTENCDDWSATVCGSETATPAERYDWTELRERVRARKADFSERVCVNLPTNARAELLERITMIVEEAQPSDGVVLRTGKRGGELPADAIETAIRARQVRLQQCYEEALTETPDAGAMQFTLRIVIGPAGTVDRAGVVDGQGTTPGIEECIVGVARELEFPEPSEGGNVVVNYPLTFSPAR